MNWSRTKVFFLFKWYYIHLFWNNQKKIILCRAKFVENCLIRNLVRCSFFSKSIWNPFFLLIILSFFLLLALCITLTIVIQLIIQSISSKLDCLKPVFERKTCCKLWCRMFRHSAFSHLICELFDRYLPSQNGIWMKFVALVSFYHTLMCQINVHARLFPAKFVS